MAWGICLGAIGVAIVATIASAIPDPAEVAAAGIAYGITAFTLGLAATTAATKATLNSLRDYEISEKSSNRLVLKRKIKTNKKTEELIVNLYIYQLSIFPFFIILNFLV